MHLPCAQKWKGLLSHLLELRPREEALLGFKLEKVHVQVTAVSWGCRRIRELESYAVCWPQVRAWLRAEERRGGKGCLLQFQPGHVEPFSPTPGQCGTVVVVRVSLQGFSLLCRKGLEVQKPQGDVWPCSGLWAGPDLARL